MICAATLQVGGLTARIAVGVPTVAALAGAERVLLGSDYPLLRARRVIDEARRTVASEDDLAAILGGNAERLLAARGGSLRPAPTGGTHGA